MSSDSAGKERTMIMHATPATADHTLQTDDHSVTRRRLMEGLAALVLAGQANQVPAGSNAKRVFTHELPDLAMKGWSVTAVEVSYAPGQSSGAHRHPGITIAYVLEGEIRSKVGDDAERTFRAGEMFLETPGQLHAVSANASTTHPARLLAVLLAESGAQLTTPEK
jgi:quercetin dioxygenase-like cupin family protein